jgi:endo-1,4-beta-D-glucanase Y
MKNRMPIAVFGGLLLLFTVAHSAAVNYPYPQRKNYPGGTINTTNSIASTNLKAKFLNFLDGFYVEGTCNGSDCARIKFDPGKENQTVSEGIGYAMIMMVYFSDATTDYQNQFDKLWKYYNSFLDNNGLMNWCITHQDAGSGFNGSTGTCGSNAATDAEFDVALALAMAHYQFGDQKYLDDAKTLIGKIRQYEMNTNGLHKPGDGWDNYKNPSYVSPAAFEIFKELETGANSTFWGTAITANYTLLTSNQNSTTGLPSGWCDASGNPTNGNASSTAYDMDATRAPWRWAWSKAWYNHTQANALLNKLASWVNGKNAEDVKGPIALNGTWGTDANSSYVGSLMNALMVSSTYQDKLNSYWLSTISISESAYFNLAMQVLTGLLATGNMPNLKACAAGNCGTNMSGGGGYNGEYTSISKFDWFDFSDGTVADNMSFAANLEPWFAYIDEGSHGTSTITNTKFPTKDENDNCADIQSYRVAMEDGGEWVAKIPSYTFSQGNNRYAPYVAIGLAANKNGDLYDLSKCTGGFSYQYKGQGHNFKVQTKAIIDEGSDHFIAVAANTTEWTEVEVPIASLKQPTTWGTKVPFDPKGIYGFIWELKGPDAANCPAGNLDASKGDNYCLNATPGTTTGISANTGNLAIKDFRCMGNMPLPTSRSAGCSEGIIEGPGNNGEEVVPVRSPKFMAANGKIFAMNNGVNLQVTNNATLQVFDLKGKVIRTLKFAQGSHVVSLSDLPRGLYIVKASSASWQQTVKMTVN